MIELPLPNKSKSMKKIELTNGDTAIVLKSVNDIHLCLYFGQYEAVKEINGEFEFLEKIPAELSGELKLLEIKESVDELMFFVEKHLRLKLDLFDRYNHLKTKINNLLN